MAYWENFQNIWSRAQANNDTEEKMNETRGLPDDSVAVGNSADFSSASIADSDSENPNADGWYSDTGSDVPAGDGVPLVNGGDLPSDTDDSDFTLNWGTDTTSESGFSEGETDSGLEEVASVDGSSNGANEPDADEWDPNNEDASDLDLDDPARVKAKPVSKRPRRSPGSSDSDLNSSSDAALPPPKKKPKGGKKPAPAPEEWDSNDADASEQDLEDGIPAPPTKRKQKVKKALPRASTPSDDGPSSGSGSDSGSESGAGSDDSEFYPDMVGKSALCGAPRPRGQPNCTQRVKHTGRAPFGCRFHPNHLPNWIRDVASDAGRYGGSDAGSGSG